MSATQEKTFFQQWLRNPLEIGAILPSSPALAYAMASQVSNVGGGTVVELGAGTGVITNALLGSGLPSKQLLVIEKDPTMADTLRRRFPGLHIVQEDATRLSRVLRSESETIHAHVMVSGLPMLLFDHRKQYTIMRQVFTHLAFGGHFLQFTYGPTPPVSRHVLTRLGITSARVAVVWHNAPPASVWRLELSPHAIM